MTCGGIYSRGNRPLHVAEPGRHLSVACLYVACLFAECLSISRLSVSRAGTGVKRKMAGSEESDKYKKKIFQKVGLFMIRHYL